MKKEFIESFETNNTAKLIDLLTPLVYSNLKNVEYKYIPDLQQELNLVILETLQTDFTTTHDIPNYLKKKEITYETFRTI